MNRYCLIDMCSQSLGFRYVFSGENVEGRGPAAWVRPIDTSGMEKQENVGKT